MSDVNNVNKLVQLELLTPHCMFKLSVVTIGIADRSTLSQSEDGTWQSYSPFLSPWQLGIISSHGIISSAFCCSSSVGGTVSPPQHVRSSGFRNCRPDDVELTANTPWPCGEQHRCIWTITQDTCFLSTSVYSALGVSAIMRYINRRFTYLLTYM